MYIVHEVKACLMHYNNTLDNTKEYFQYKALNFQRVL